MGVEVAGFPMAEEAPDTLQQAEDALQTGRIETARQILIEYLQRVPASERAWWLLSFTVPEVWQKIDCLERLLALNPANADAQQRLVRLRSPKEEPPPSTVKPFVFDSEEERYLAEATVAAPAPRPAAPAPVRPAPDFASAPSAGPPKKKRSLLPSAILALLLCTVLGLGAYAGFGYYQQQRAQAIQQTALIAQALTDLPAQSQTPSWTPSPSLTPLPSRTRTPTRTRIPSSTTTETSTPHPTLTRGVASSDVGTLRGDFAPDFSLVEVSSGEPMTLSQFKGQAVLLVFWATWCPVCGEQIPFMEQVYQAYKDSGLVVLAVDSGEASSLARSFRSSHPMSYYVLADADKGVSNTYGIDSIPRNFFIFPTGRISLVVKGGLDFSALERHVKEILPVRVPFTTTP
jgi:peroxiredoxin